MSNQHEEDSCTPRAPTVCVIGCGPGGMFFLHALAMRRHKLEQEGDCNGLASLPEVTCYERSSSPGGVWRSHGGEVGGGHQSVGFEDGGEHEDHNNSFHHAPHQKLKSEMMEHSLHHEDDEPSLAALSSDEQSEETTSAASSTTTSTNMNMGITNMYESLWTNGNKEPMEFFDYTFDDHFQRQIPVFMPRRHVLEYMLHRVTTKENVFENYVTFNATVTSVSYNASTCKFTVSASLEKHDGQQQQVETREYDKVIWSGGKNGLPNLPQDSYNLLRMGGFHGELLHSTEVHDLDTAACGKRLVFVGDNYSAEDLALTSLKLGAEKVFITSRGGYGTTCCTSAWPGNRVEILWYQMPCGVTADGNGIVFQPAVWNDDTKTYDVDYDGEKTVVEDVSTVIFCTGYRANLDYIDPELRPNWNSRELGEKTFSVPDGWKMKQNCLSDDLGNVEPSAELKGGDYYVKNGSGIYRHLLMKNPNMMYLYDACSYPLLELDVAAWLCLGYICGDVAIPSLEEMERQNIQQLLDEMSVPYLRYYKDSNYYSAVNELPEDHWKRSENYGTDEYQRYSGEYYRYEVQTLARDMKAGGYPADFGTKEELNERGESLVRMTLADCKARYVLKKEGPENAWRTFRDCDPSPFKSYFTGTKAAPLEGHWMDLDEEGHVAVDHHDTY